MRPLRETPSYPMHPCRQLSASFVPRRWSWWSKVIVGLLALGAIAACNSPASVDVQPAGLVLRHQGQESSLRVTVKDSAGNVLQRAQVLFVALTPEVLTVDRDDGVVTALRTGDGAVLVKVGDITKKVDVRVRIADRMQIEPARPLLNVGVTTTLQATLLDDRGKPMVARRPIRWSSSDPSIASIDRDARLRTLKEGQTTITAYGDDVEGSALVTVRHEKYDEKKGWH